MSVPASRALATVLREAAAPDLDKLQLVLASGGAAIGAPEGNAYVNVVIEGVTVKVPRLYGATVASVGGPAYVLVTRNFMLYIGTVKTT